MPGERQQTPMVCFNRILLALWPLLRDGVMQSHNWLMTVYSLHYNPLLDTSQPHTGWGEAAQTHFRYTTPWKEMTNWTSHVHTNSIINEDYSLVIGDSACSVNSFACSVKPTEILAADLQDVAFIQWNYFGFIVQNFIAWLSLTTVISAVSALMVQLCTSTLQSIYSVLILVIWPGTWCQGNTTVCLLVYKKSTLKVTRYNQRVVFSYDKISFKVPA